jgi:hypothetical protein
MKILMIAGLCLIALPVLAAQDAPVQPVAELQSPAATLSCPATAELPEALAISTLSTCTAQCWDGTTRSCSGTSCTATDSACRAWQQGSCWSNAEGTKKCELCPCNRSPHCADLEGTSCGSGTTTCYEPSLNCHPLSCACHDHQWVCA